MNKIFIVLIAMLLSVGNVDAQSKKELKALAKRQELIAATTDDNSSRYFKMPKRLSHINIKIRDCYISGSTVRINLLISNPNPDDEYLNLIGDECSWHDSSNYYKCCNNMAFAIGDSKNFKENLYDVFIPGSGVLKVAMTIDKVNANTTIINDFSLAIQSKLKGGTYTSSSGGTSMCTYHGTVYYLDVN